MPNIRIKDIPTTASASSSTDFLALDGSGSGTRKLNAFSPTFGGNLTVSGTTDSSSTTTGSLITSGGLGVAKAGYFGGNIVSANSTNTGNLDIAVANTNTGAAANSRLYAYNGSYQFVFELPSTGFTTSGQRVANRAYLWTDGAQGLTLHTINGSMRFVTGNPGTVAGTIDSSQNWSLAGNLTVSGGTITGGASGMSLASGGTNQNITLTPSGTGNVIAGNSFRVGGTAPADSVAGYTSIELGYKGHALLGGSNDNWWTTNAYFAGGGWKRGANQLVAAINANAGDFIFKQAGAGAADSAITWTDSMTLYRNGNLLIGTTTDSGNGKLQLATHTTSAGGIGFGTDTQLYRSSANAVTLGSGGNSQFNWLSGASERALAQWTSGVFELGSVGSASVRFITNNTTALTLDSSQNATFAGNVTLSNSGNAFFNLRYGSGGFGMVEFTRNSVNKGRIYQNSSDELFIESATANQAIKLVGTDATFAGSVKATTKVTIGNSAQSPSIYGSSSVAVGTTAVDLSSTSFNTGAIAVVSGYNTSGGQQGVWLIIATGGGLISTIASQNATGLTPTFSISAGKLQMSLASGSMSVVTTMVGVTGL